MSKTLSAQETKKFENEAQQAFQETTSELMSYVRKRDIPGAGQFQFQVIGSVVANERTSTQTMIPVADATHSNVTATTKNYVVSELTDIFSQARVGFDERTELAQALGASMNRRVEQVIIDALDAHSFTNTVAKNISGSNDNLNVAMLAEASRQLGSKVPKKDRCFLCHDDGFHHFIQESDVKTIDSNYTKPQVDGKLPYFFGFNIKEIADRDEGGLTLSTNDRTNYAWQKNAIGLAITMKPKIMVDWSPDFGAWRTSGFLSMGAVVIQDSGVVKITSDES